MFSAILLAGGAGVRMRRDVPKQFLPLGGRPMILHTLERLERINEISEIVIVCLPEYRNMLLGQLDAYVLSKKCVVIDGGKTRQESTYLGLCAASESQVIIHEAARPFVTEAEFRDLIEDPASAVTYGVPIPFTVSIAKEGFISDLLTRNSLVNIQLPQKFDRNALLEAHMRAKEEQKEFTEDASLYYYYSNNAVKVLPGTQYNIKITENVDLLTGEVIYKEYIVGRD